MRTADKLWIVASLLVVAFLGMLVGAARATPGHPNWQRAIVRCSRPIQEDMAFKPILVDFPGQDGVIVYRCRMNPSI